MKKLFLFSILLFAATFFFSACNESNAPVESLPVENEQFDKTFGDENFEKGNSGEIVIANRNSGTISVINTKTDEVTGTYQLPAGPNNPEPMYVVSVKRTQRVFVGDRANNQVVVFRASDYSVETTISVGQGVFHMWADPQGKQLWVNNDIDNTTSVINLRTLQVIETVPTPQDLVNMGGKPHDVILGPRNKFAYITVLGLAGANDYVVQFSTKTFQETGRTAVGKDPHLSLNRRSKKLFVPCQNSNAVYVINRYNMNLMETISVPGSHGAGMITNGKVFYTTNLTGGGSNGLFAINTRSNQVLGSEDTPYPVPHNIALTTSAKKLYLTHSGGTSDKVTVYRISNRNPVPVFMKEITVGLNPFGLSFVQ